MTGNTAFCKDRYSLPVIACEEWLGWVFITLNPSPSNISEELKGVEQLVEGYNMTDYSETFFEEHLWDTNWKVLAENLWKVIIYLFVMLVRSAAFQNLTK